MRDGKTNYYYFFTYKIKITIMFYENLFYFDIETVGQYKDIESLRENDEKGYDLFVKKFKNNPWMSERHQDIGNAYLEYSPIFSSFGKIVCISFGYFHNKNDQGYTVMSIYGDDEEKIVKEFNTLLYKVGQKNMLLSGYRITSFDIPWVLHKLHKYDITPSKIIDIYGLKPWEMRFIDLADEWKQKFKYYNTFDEVCYELGVESPKDDIDGSMVHSTYWYQNDLDRIKTYCEKDVYSSMLVGKKILSHKL